MILTIMFKEQNSNDGMIFVYEKQLSSLTINTSHNPCVEPLTNLAVVFQATGIQCYNNLEQMLER